MYVSYIERTRQNHALEHATIALLLQKLGSNLRLVGRSTANGFYIYGEIPIDLLEQCAHEALGRLKNGEADLAVSPLCGTNLAVAGMLAGVSSLLALGQKRRSEAVSRVILAATGAVLIAQPLGRLVQKYVTTSPHLEGVQIKSVTKSGSGRWAQYKVETRIG